MALELSNETFTNQADVVPPFGVKEILNTGVANTLGGNDRITSIGTKFNLVNRLDFDLIGTGFYNIGTLNTADDNDIITGIHRPNESDPYPDNPIGFNNIRSYGIFNEKGGILDTSNGNDIIIGISEAKQRSGSAATFAAVGIENYEGIINTGDGNDAIVGISDIGIYNDYYSNIDTGKGNDLISGTGRTGIINITGATIDTGSGDDIITGTSNISPSSNIYGSGLSNFGTIDTGEGNDIIVITSAGTGLYNFGTINMGNGADSLIINRASNNLIGTVLVGDGNDYIKVFSDGNLNGENGKDTLELPSGNYIVRISETRVDFTQFHPTTLTNTIMKTSGFEKLIAGSTTYDFTNLTDGQTILVA
jgi:hypothetical protein